MQKIIGHLKELQGEFFARDAQGHLRPLRPGDPVYEGETVVDKTGRILNDPFHTPRTEEHPDHSDEIVTSADSAMEHPRTHGSSTSAVPPPTGIELGIFDTEETPEVHIETRIIDAQFREYEFPTIPIHSSTHPIFLESYGEKTVYEEGLSTGSHAHGLPSTASGTLVVHATDGLREVTIDGGSGPMALSRSQLEASSPDHPLRIDTGEGILSITGLTMDHGEYRIQYLYQLQGNLDHSTAADQHTLSDSVHITAETFRGETNSRTLHFSIVDDTPIVSTDRVNVEEDDTIHSMMSGSLFGNDIAGADRPLQIVTVMGQGPNAGDKWVFVNDYGRLEIHRDGSYSYELDNSSPVVQALGDGQVRTLQFAYRVADADGDMADVVLNIDIEGRSDAPSPTPPPEIYVSESALPGGSNPSSGFQASEGFFVDAKEGLDHITVAGQSVSESALLDAQNSPIVIPTQYGTITINGFVPMDANHIDGSGRVLFTYTLTGNTTDHDHNDVDFDTQVYEQVAITVHDKNGNTGSTEINIVIVDDTPTAHDDANATVEGNLAVVTGNVVTSGSGADTIGADHTDTPVTAVRSLNVQQTGAVGASLEGEYGTLTLNSDGSYSYTVRNGSPEVETLPKDMAVYDRFVYTITDADGDTSTAQLTITITGTNDAPVITAVNDLSATEDGSSVSGSVTFNDVDSGDTHTFSIATTPSEGSVTIDNTGTYTFDVGSDFQDLAAGETRTVTFDVRVTDNHGASAVQSVNVTVTGTNDAPVIESVTPVVRTEDQMEGFSGYGPAWEGAVYTIVSKSEMLSHLGISDVDSSTFSVHLKGITSPQWHGGIQSDNSTFSDDATPEHALLSGSSQWDETVVEITQEFLDNYPQVNAQVGDFYIDHVDFDRLVPGESATIEFDIVVDDGASQNHESNVARMVVTVTGIDDGVTVSPPSPQTVYESGLSTGSHQPGESASVSGDFIFDAPDAIFGTGKVTFDGGSPLSFSETELQNSSASNPLQVDTGQGILYITSYTTTPGTGLAKIEYTYVLKSAQNHANGDGNNELTDSIAITVTDRNGSEGSETLDIHIVDDVPAAANDVNGVTEDTAPNPVIGNVVANDVIGADHPDTPVVAVHSDTNNTDGTIGSPLAGAYGTLTLQNNGAYTYVLDNTNPNVQALGVGETASDLFTYAITDADGDTSTAQLTITITGTNDAPVITAVNDLSATEDGSSVSGSVTFSDVDVNDTHSFSVTQPTEGSVTIDNTTGTYTFDVGSDFQDLPAGETRTVTFDVRVTDNQGASATQTVNVTVTGTNDVPVISGVSSGSVTEDSGVDGSGMLNASGTLTIADVDSGESSFQPQSNTAGTYGSFTVDANGNWHYSADNSQSAIQQLGAGESLSETFTVTSADGSKTQDVTVTVTGTNDAPVANVDGNTYVGLNLEGTGDALVYDSRGSNPDLLGGAGSVNVAMTITGQSGSNSLLSYAAPAHNNEFLLFTNDTGTSVGVYINGANKSLSLGSSIYDGNEHRLEVSWDNTTGEIVVKVDGSVTDTDTLKQGYTLGTGGVLMFGQEQDTTGGGLDPQQIFKGTYSDLSIDVDGAPAAHWTMDESENGVIKDQIGNFDLALVGDAAVLPTDSELITNEDTPLTINASYLLANDTDVDQNDTLSIVSVQDAQHGSVSYDAGTGKITFTPDTDYYGAAQFSYTISDGHGGTDTQRVYLQVNGVNDAPIATDDSYTDIDTTAIGLNLNGTDGALSFDSRGSNPELLGGAGAVNVAMTIAGQSGSNSLLSYAAPAHNNEFLLFTNDTGTSVGVYINGANKSLSLGSSIYDGNEHRLEVSWDNTTGEIVVKVDGSVTDTDTLKQGYTLGTGGVLMFGQEQDTTGGGLDPQQIFKGTYSDLSIDVDGAPAAHWTMDSISNGVVSDTVGNYDLSATGDVTVVPYNNPLITDEDTPLVIDEALLLLNDSDPDAGDSIGIVSVQNAQHGTVSYDAGTGQITFTPDANYNGEASFRYTVSDGNGGNDTATVTLNVNAVNDAPVAVDDTIAQVDNHKIDVSPAHAAINAGKTIVLTDAFTISQKVKVTGAGIVFNKEVAYEVAVESDGSVRYALRADNGSGWTWNDTGYDLPFNEEHMLTMVYSGADQILKTYVDGTLVATSTANVPASLYTGNNTTEDLLFGERGANNQSLAGTFDDIRIYNTALNDTEVLNIAGETSGLVAAYDFEGSNPLADKSGNGNDATLQSGAAVITVTEGPTEDTTFTVDAATLLTNDSDVDGDTLSLDSVSNAQHGSVSYDVQSGKITFIPEANYNGPASFDYTVSDGNGGTDTATVNFNIQSVNDLPVVTAPASVQTSEDNSVDIAYTVTDVEDDAASVPLNVTASAQHGTVTLNGNGTVTYQPNADYNGTDTVTITATDSDGGVTVSQTAVTVTPVNDAPVAVDDTQMGTVVQYVDVTPAHAAVNTGKTIALTDAFTISQKLTVTGPGIVFNKENSYEVAIEGDGSVRYAMRGSNGQGWVWNDTGYDLPMNEEHTLTVVYSGADQTLKTYVDGALVATSTANVPASLTTAYQNSYDLLFGERGANNQSLEGTLDDIRIYDRALSSAEVGNIGTETVGLVAAYDFEGSNPLADKSGNGNDATLQNGATVETVIYAPSPIATDEDTPLTFDAQALVVNDSDVDGDYLTVTGVTATADTHGTVTLNNDGTITYVPETDYNGTASFEYTVSDGNGGSDTATVTLNVLPVNDVPVIDSTTLLQPSREGMVFWNDMDEASSSKTDLSQNGHTATQVGSSGIYTIADDAAINLGSYDQKTIAASFTTGSVSASDPFQVIYEQGGAWNGYSISVKGDHLYASVWGESYSTIDPNYAIIDLGQIQPNTDYNVVMVHDGTAANGGTLTAYLNGVANPDVKTGVGQMGAHSGDVGIGGYKNGTIDPTNPTADVNGAGGQFQGTVHEVMSWNSASSTVVGDANNYLNSVDDTTTDLSAALSGTVALFDVDASDVEDGTNLTYSLQNDHNGLFGIEAATGIVTVDADSLVLPKNYTLTVDVTDSGGASASTTLDVNVTEGIEAVHLDMNGNTNDTADSGSVVDNGRLHKGASVANGDTLVLDGVDDYLDFADSADIDNGTHAERSVSLWFKTGDGTGTQYVYAEGGGIRSLQIYTEDGVLKAKGYNDPDSENGWKSANATVLDSQIDVSDDQWHHVVITTAGDPSDPLHGLAADGFKLYLDGTLVDSGTGGALYGHDNAHIGSYYNGSQTFEGEIDGFRLYNDALNGVQVQELYGELQNGQVIDGVVEGLYYETSSGMWGYTDEEGNFDYAEGDSVTFKVGSVTLGTLDTDSIEDGKVFLQDIADVERSDLDDEYVENMAVFLQSLDSDGNADNGIVIDEAVQLQLRDDAVDLSALSEDALANLIESNGFETVDEQSAMEHVGEMLSRFAGIEAVRLDMEEESVEPLLPKSDVAADSVQSAVLADTSEPFAPQPDPTVTVTVDDTVPDSIA